MRPNKYHIDGYNKRDIPITYNNYIFDFNLYGSLKRIREIERVVAPSGRVGLCYNDIYPIKKANITYWKMINRILTNSGLSFDLLF